MSTESELLRACETLADALYFLDVRASVFAVGEVSRAVVEMNHELGAGEPRWHEVRSVAAADAITALRGLRDVLLAELESNVEPMNAAIAVARRTLDASTEGHT